MFGMEKQEVIRALNISEAGVAGLFVTGWDAGTAVKSSSFVPVVRNPLSVDDSEAWSTSRIRPASWSGLSPAWPR